MQVLPLVDVFGLQHTHLALRVRLDVVASRERHFAEVSIWVVINVDVKTTEVTIKRYFDEAQVCVNDRQRQDAPACVLC